MTLAEWLEEIELGQYAEAFEAQAVGIALLPTLTDTDLREIGITVLGHRKKLLAAIARLAAPAAPGTSHAAERRQLTVAFFDLVGSTALSSALDPEDLRALIRDYQNLVAGEVARFGGHVAQYLGDGVLAYFGWPRAHEDNAERAVRAALAIVAALAAGRTPGRPLQVRIGIATGEVIVGDLIDEGSRSRETAVGETPNLAARLQALAEPGAILLSDGTRRLLGATFALQALAPQSIKGLPEPVPVFRVLGERAVGSRYAARAGTVAVLYGRDEELGLLRARWQRATEAEGQIVVIGGEAGIGKSRLAEAAIDLVHRSTHFLLRYQCSPFHTDAPLHPVIEQLRRAARIAADDPPERQLAKLRTLLETGTRDVDTALHFVASLFGLDSGIDGPPGLTPLQRLARTHEVLIAQLIGLSALRPVLWVFEDAHWIDPSMLELLERAAAQIGRHRILMVITHRPGFASSLLNQPNCSLLTLSALPRPAATELILAQTHGRPLPAMVVDEVLARTDGVPLYIEETTRAVLESGMLAEVDGQLVARGDGQAGIVPATLRDSLLARLDRLGEAKTVAQTAAVIGRTFDYPTLAASFDLPHDLDTSLRRLEESGLMFRSGTPPDASYTFKHALVRDVAYESLLRARRVELHGRVLDAFESQGSVADAVMAQHAEAALRDEAALTHWERATVQALAVPALREALSRNENALRVCRRLDPTESRRRREQALYVQRAQITIPIFGYTAEPTREAFARAYQIARELDDLSLQLPAAYGLVPVYYVAGEPFREAAQLADLAARDDHDGPGLVAARLQGLVAFHDGDFETARRLFVHAIESFDEARHPELLRGYGQDNATAAATYLCLVEWITGNPAEALRTAEWALARAKALNHANTRLYTHSLGRMQLAILMRKRDDVVGMAREALELSERYGAGNYVGWARMALMWATGDVSFAAGFNDDTTFGRWRHLSWALTAETFLQAADFRAGEQCIDKALAWLNTMGDAAFAAEIHRRHAEVLLHADAGQRAAAVAALELSLDIANRQQARSWALRAARDLARLWAETGERQRALDLLAPIHATFASGFDTLDLVDAAALLAELA